MQNNPDLDAAFLPWRWKQIRPRSTQADCHQSMIKDSSGYGANFK
jgi:hypothetical protein